MRLAILVITILVFIILNGGADATEYYISADGDNANDGLTTATAWRNLSYAVNQSALVGSGTTIYVIDGVISDWWTSIFRSVNNNCGNSTHPILITAYNGTPIIDGTNAETNPNYAFKIGDSADPTYACGFIKISNLTFRNYYEIFDVRNSKNITIENNTFYNVAAVNATSDIGQIATSQNITLNNNTFHDVMGYNSVNIIGPGDNYWITNNSFYNNNKHGALQTGKNISNLYVISNRMWNNTYSGGFIYYKWAANEWGYNIVVRDTTITDDKNGIALYSVNDTLIENATITNTSTGSLVYGLEIKPTSYSDGLYAFNVTFRNITIHNQSSWIFVQAGDNITFDKINVLNRTSAYDYRIQNTQPAIGTKAPIIIRDEVEPIWKIAMNVYSNVSIEYTDGNVISRTTNSGGVNVTVNRHYPTNSSLFMGTWGGYTGGIFTILKRNITVVPSASNVTATNTTSNLAIDQQNNTIGHIYVNFSAPIPQMNISISNVSSRTNLRLRYAGNDTEITYYDVGANLTAYFNLSLGNDNYNITESPPPTFIPPTPINLTNTTGNFWVNHTWTAGAGNITDSYNVSVNGAWYNGTTNTYNLTTVSASEWVNISVWAFNNSGGGTLSASAASMNTQAPAAPTLTPTPTATTGWDTYRNDTSTWETLGGVLKIAILISIIVSILGAAKGKIKTMDAITIITFDVIILVVVYAIAPIIGSLLGQI